MEKSNLDKRLLPLINQAQGRCHSCANQQIFDLPTGPIYYCRAYLSHYEQEERDAVRRCPRWAPFRALDSESRGHRIEDNPLFAPIVEAEDQLFWQLKVHLDTLGVDLKSVLILAQPSIKNGGQLKWVDTLDKRFSSDELEEDVEPLECILAELEALHYPNVCELLRRLVPPSEHDTSF